MHPFSLKQENIKKVTGGVYQAVTFGINETGGCIPGPVFVSLNSKENI
jgi:hypothetical protein